MSTAGCGHDRVEDYDDPLDEEDRAAVAVGLFCAAVGLGLFLITVIGG